MPNHNGEFAITCPTVFDGERFLDQHCVILRDDAIINLMPVAELPTGIDTLQLEHGTLAPGLIDLQVNGGGDVMFQSAPTVAAINRAVTAHRTLGTTTMLPTVLSDTAEHQQTAVERINAARQQGNAGILGVHIEGPFFNREKRGAHSESRIRKPGTKDINWLCNLDVGTLLVTLAPEAVPPQYIEQLADSGVLVCAGHTMATYQQMTAAHARGLGGVTHLFNAMSAATGREPATVGAALDIDSLWAGIIADGHHVHPANIRLAHDAKPPGKLVLVSDAMASVGGVTNLFELYGEEVREQEGRLVNSDGVLAGSAIGMIDAVRYSCRKVGLPLQECLRMASLYPAAILALEQTLGRIAPGYRADLVHFDDDFAVQHTWLAGQHQSHDNTHRETDT